MSDVAAKADFAARAASNRRLAFVRHMLSHKGFVIGAAMTILMTAIAIVAPFLMSDSPLTLNVRHRFSPPSEQFFFGTDHYGRDVFVRVVYGAGLSLSLGLWVVLCTGVLGTLVGTLSGYFRRIDSILMRLMDALMAFPSLMLAIAIAAALGSGAANVVIALSIAYAPRTARIVRASVLMVRDAEYVEAARLAGASHLRIIFRHILPNSMAPLIIDLTFVFAYAVLAEAALSFLGVGPPPPTPSWGNILAEGRDYVVDAPWITTFPGLIIAFTVLGLNLFGDGLRDVLDPKLKTS